jgi:micrococcal nuclease
MGRASRRNSSTLRAVTLPLALAFGAGIAVGVWSARNWTAPPREAPDDAAVVLPVAAEVPGAALAPAASLDRVVDGDTIHVLYRHEEPLAESIRLLFLDTPERGEPGYDEATAALESLLAGTTVSLQWEGDEAERDRYGRLLAYVMAGETNVNLEMVRLGWSRYHTKFGTSERFDAAFRAAEAEAKAARRGMWRDE